MYFRDIQDDDVKRLKEICEQHEFPLPANRDIVASGVVVDSDIIAFGVVRSIYEVIVALDTKRSKKDRVRALRMLMEYGLMRSYRAGVDEWHAFISDPVLCKALLNMGFIRCKGDPILLNFGEMQ